MNNLAFVLDKFGFEPPKEWTIRICLSGLDNGHAIWLENTIERETLAEAETMVDEIISRLPDVKHFKE